MIDSRTYLVAAALFVGMLGACNAQEDMLGRFLVAPDKFVLYSCPQIAVRTTGTVARLKQLDALIAKAGDSFDGRLVSALAYKSERAEMIGDLNELRRAAADKNCRPAPSPSQAPPRAIPR